MYLSYESQAVGRESLLYSMAGSESQAISREAGQRMTRKTRKGGLLIKGNNYALESSDGL